MFHFTELYPLNLTFVLFMFVVYVRLTGLGCNHHSSVAFVVLVVYVYKGTGLKPVYDVHKAFAASHHQAILLKTVRINNRGIVLDIMGYAMIPL